MRGGKEEEGGGEKKEEEEEGAGRGRGERGGASDSNLAALALPSGPGGRMALASSVAGSGRGARSLLQFLRLVGQLKVSGRRVLSEAGAAGDPETARRAGASRSLASRGRGQAPPSGAAVPAECRRPGRLGRPSAGGVRTAESPASGGRSGARPGRPGRPPRRFLGRGGRGDLRGPPPAGLCGEYWLV